MIPELTESWRFEYEGLAGYISGGHEHGVELTVGDGRMPLTRPMCLNVEHYYSRSRRGGRFVPRYKADVRSERLDERTVRVDIAPYGEWQVSSTVTYRLLPDLVIEASYVFSFEDDYDGFEAFISNYFHEPTEPYLHLGGQWVRVGIKENEHRFWARGRDEAAAIAEIHAREIDAREEIHLPVDAAFYDHPIMITTVGDSDWSVVSIVEREMCPSLSANRRWNAHDFSIGGLDVCKGDTITCRAWLAYARLGSLDDALGLSERLIGAQ